MLLNVKKPQNYLDVAISLSKELAQSCVDEREAKVVISEYEIERLRESGLLVLVVPKQYGGVGATWVKALKILQELSQADSSIGQIYGNHLILTALAHISGTPEQKEKYYQQTACNNWFWADAINRLDTRLTIIPDGDKFRINGVSFGTDIAAANVRVFSTVQTDVEQPLFLVIPKERDGIICNQYWDKIGQDKTASSSFTFHNVLIEKDETFGLASFPTRPFAAFFNILTQLTKTYVYLGIAKSALESAENYNETVTQAKNTSEVESAKLNQYQPHYQELWMELKTAIAQTEEVAEIMQASWDKEFTLTHEEIKNVESAVFSTKIYVTQVGVNIGNCLFELIGNNSSVPKYRIERYWSDLQALGGVSIPWNGAPQNWKLTYLPTQQTPC